MKFFSWISFLAAFTAVASTLDAEKIYRSELYSFRIETLTQRSQVVWGFDFLPDGRILFTEKSGGLFWLNSHSKQVTKVSGVPPVTTAGQGGLLDVRVHPEFYKNHRIYFTYSKSIEDKSTTALGRGQLESEALVEFKELFSARESGKNKIHYGSRVEFSGKGHVFVSVGDRDERERAQDLAAHNGKIIRLGEDGSIPADNPFVGRKGALQEIWSLGHRNPQGLTRHPVTGDLWSTEMGPRGGDEVNLIAKGANYGWPAVTHGREYWGPTIGDAVSKPGLAESVVFYVPSISPSGIDFYKGDRFLRWKGNLFLGCLSGQQLRRLVLDGHRVTHQEILLGDVKTRFRQVRSGPDGLLYFSTDDGRIARLTLVP